MKRYEVQLQIGPGEGTGAVGKLGKKRKSRDNEVEERVNKKNRLPSS